MRFKSSFQILAEISSICYQHQRSTCWKLTTALGKKIFLRVCGMGLYQSWYNLFGYCVLHGNWVRDGCDDYIICTTNIFIQISLEFRKWLGYNDFICEDPTVFISSNSILYFYIVHFCLQRLIHYFASI